MSPQCVHDYHELAIRKAMYAFLCPSISASPIIHLDLSYRFLCYGKVSLTGMASLNTSP